MPQALGLQWRCKTLAWDNCETETRRDSALQEQASLSELPVDVLVEECVVVGVEVAVVVGVEEGDVVLVDVWVVVGVKVCVVVPVVVREVVSVVDGDEVRLVVGVVVAEVVGVVVGVEAMQSLKCPSVRNELTAALSTAAATMHWPAGLTAMAAPTCISSTNLFPIM